MLRKRLAAIFIPLCVVTGTAAIVSAQTSRQPDTSESAAKLSETLSVLHAVAQWSTRLSEMANKRAKSDLVKGYAREVATSNKNLDAKIQRVAKNGGSEVRPLDARTEEGKSLMDRMRGEAALLESLQGDAFDKEYMTLVTNTQQSTLHLLEKSKASAMDPDVKQFLSDLTTTVQNRLKTAQSIMKEVYGDTI